MLRGVPGMFWVVLGMFWRLLKGCPGDVLRDCSGNVLGLFGCCWLFCGCFEVVLVMFLGSFWNCSGDVLEVLGKGCSGYVLGLFWACSEVVLVLLR